MKRKTMRTFGLLVFSLGCCMLYSQQPSVRKPVVEFGEEFLSAPMILPRPIPENADQHFIQEKDVTATNIAGFDQPHDENAIKIKPLNLILELPVEEKSEKPYRTTSDMDTPLAKTPMLTAEPFDERAKPAIPTTPPLPVNERKKLK